MNYQNTKVNDTSNQIYQIYNQMSISKTDQ